MLLFVLGIHNVYAQSSSEDSIYNKYVKSNKPSSTGPFSLDRVIYGGNVSARFGPITFVDVSPLVGYRFTDNFNMSVGFIYLYYSERYSNFTYSTSMYGPRINARRIIFQNIFAQADFSMLNVPGGFPLNERTWINNLFVGGGLRQPISDRVSFVGSIMFNLTNSTLSPYGNPLLQFGVFSGF